MTAVDLAPLRKIYATLVKDTTAAAGDARKWDGWFRWLEMTDDNWRSGRLSVPVEYGPKMDSLWAAFEEAGWQERIFDWPAWIKARDGPFDKATIAMSTIDDLTKLLTAIRRQERFNDGHWRDCLVSGVFTKVALTWLTLMRYPAGDLDFTVEQ